MSRSAQFDHYVARVREGKSGLGRLAAGTLLVLVAWGVATVAALFFGMAALLVISLSGGEPFDFSDPATLMQRFTASRTGLLALLLSLAGLWLGVWMALKWLHKRRISTVLSAAGRLDRGDFLRAFAVFSILPFILQIISLTTEEGVVANPIGVAGWLVGALALVPVLLIQTSAEEVFFRGYLPQNLAARFGSPLIWGLLPALAFSLLHWRGGISMQMNLAMFGGILAFALALTALMARTGSLAASMGAHFGNNLMAILFVSHDDLFAQAALFNGMPLHLIDAGWASAAGQLAATAGMVAIGFLALMHPRSPLALDAVRGHNGRVLT